MTIWLNREQLTRTGALARLFARFDAMLAERGFLAIGGQIVDATEKPRMGLVVRSIGLVRATARITLANLAYNMRRLVWIEGRAAPV